MINESEVFSLFDRHCSRIKSGGNNQYLALCPFHDDTRHSFSFNSEGLYNCKGCGESGNAVKFAKLQNENPKPYYSDEYKRTDGKQTGKPIKNGLNGGKSTETVDKTTVKQRAIDLTPKLKEYEIKYPKNEGYEPFMLNDIGKDKDGAITIPYWEDGKCVGIKHHKPKNGKQSWWEGDGRIKWYNSWVFDVFNKDQLIICEGEKDANRLVQLDYNATSTSGGALSVPPIPDKFKEPKELILLYDNDESGIKGSEKCAEQIYRSTGTLPYIAQWRTGLPKGFDAFDDETGEEVKYAINKKRIYESASSSQKGYTVVSVLDALKMDIHKPRMLIEDLLNENCTLLLSAEDNVGKSMMANQMGLCLATGQDFLSYLVPEPIKVLLVQHEMENGEQTDRLKTQVVPFVESYPDLMAKNLFMNLIQESENLAVTDQFEMLERTFTHNPEIEVCVFDNIGQSTNVAMTKPDEIRQELKRLKALCRRHKVAFVLVAHHNKIDWGKEMDLVKTQIQGGKPVTDWADNVLQLHTSSLNTGLVLFKITKVRSVHAQDGTTSKYMPQAVWFNQDLDLLFKDRFTVTNWQGHFKALDKYEDELAFVKDLAEYPQPFTTNDAINVGNKFDKSVTTIKAHWLKKLVNPMGWLIKQGHGQYRVNQKVLDFIKVSES